MQGDPGLSPGDWAPWAFPGYFWALPGIELLSIMCGRRPCLISKEKVSFQGEVVMALIPVAPSPYAPTNSIKS